MTSDITPHLMTRATPGDTRCARCGLTASTKAHRAARDAAKAGTDQGDQGDQGAATDQGDQGDQGATVTDIPNQAVSASVGASDQGVTAMQATVNRAALVTALAYVVKGVPARPSVPALAGMVLTVAGGTLTAHTFDWSVFRSADVPADGATDGRVTVGGKSLVDGIKALDKSIKVVTLAVSVTMSGPVLTVSGPDGTLIDFDTMPTEDMPPVPTPDHVIGTIDAAQLGALASAVVGAVGTDEVAPITCSVRVRTDGKAFQLAASDRFRLHIADGAWSPASEGDCLVAPGSEYAVPGKILKEVAALFAKRAGKVPATVTVSVGRMSPAAPLYALECDGYRLMTDVSVNEFPPVDRLMPKSPRGTVEMDARGLVAMLTAVSVGGTRKVPGNVILAFADGAVTAEYWTRECEDKPARTATVPAVIEGDVTPEIMFNPFYVLDALAALASADTVVWGMNGANKPFTIGSGTVPAVRTLVMPIRFTGRPTVTPVPASDVPAAVPTVEATAPAVEGVDQAATVPAATDAVTVPAPVEASPAARTLVDGRDALAGAIAGPAPEARAAAILPAGALAAVTSTPGPSDFDAYRDQIGMCECPVCIEMAYNAHHWCNRADQVHAARVLLAQLAAGTHVRVTMAEHVADAKAHRAWLVGQAEAAGKTGEALDRVKHPDVYMRLAAKESVRDSFVNGSGLGMTPGGIIGTPRSRAYWTEQAAKRREADALAGDQAAPALAAVPAVEATVTAVESVDQAAPAGDQGDTDAIVRAMIAGATWSYGTGHAGKGRGRKAIRGPMMTPKLDGYVPRDVWTALADTVHALGGGAWMSDVKAFAVQSSDVGTPWSKGHRSTQERAAEYLAVTAPASAAPAVPALAAVPAVEATVTAVESVDQAAPVPAAVTVPAAPRKRDPKRALRSLVSRLAPADTVTSADVDESTGVVSIKGVQPSDDQVSKIMGERYRYVERVAGIVGHYDRFAPVAARPVDQGDTVAPVTSVHTFDSTGDAYDAVNTGDVPDGAVLNVPTEKVVGFVNDAWPVAVTVQRGEFAAARDLDGPEFDRYRASIDAARTLASVGVGIGYALAGDQVAPAAPALAAVPPAREIGVPMVSEIGHPLAVDPAKPVTVTLVYAADAPAAVPVVEAPAPAVESVPALAGGGIHGAHAQRVNVSRVGELDGYRFHLVAGVGCRQFAKPIRKAFHAAGIDGFSVTTPSGSGTVNIAAHGDVSDWSPVLALVAGIIGDKITDDSAMCAACDRSHALADS